MSTIRESVYPFAMALRERAELWHAVRTAECRTAEAIGITAVRA